MSVTDDQELYRMFKTCQVSLSFKTSTVNKRLVRQTSGQSACYTYSWLALLFFAKTTDYSRSVNYDMHFFFFYDRYTVLIGVQMALKLSVEGRTKFLRCKISLSYVFLGKSKGIVDGISHHILVWVS